jgi:PEGA domain
MRLMKSIRRRALLVIAFASIATPARAQTGPPPTSLSQSLQGEAKEAYDSGNLLVSNGDFAGALTKLRQAYEASKDPRLLYEMALCEKELRRYAPMQSLLERYLREAEGTIPEDIRAAVEQALVAIKSLVATVTVTAIEPEATVLVDGEVVGMTPLPAPLILDLGKHTIVAKKAGFETSEQTLDVVGGGVASVALVLIVRPHVGQLVITSDADATIKVDDRVVGAGHFEGQLEPGSHAVELSERGKETYRAVIELHDGETRTVQVTLDDRKHPSFWPWLIGGAAVVAGAAVGSYFLFKVHDETVAPEGKLGTVYLP